jgi:hypothetical protein
VKSRDGWARAWARRPPRLLNLKCRMLYVVVAAAFSAVLGVTVASGQLAVPYVAERVYRATVASSGAVVTQNGTWIKQVDHPSAGNYVLTFATGAFYAVPTCIWSAVGTQGVGPGGIATTVIAPALSCLPATMSSIGCQARAQSAQGQATDTDIAIVCVGR